MLQEDEAPVKGAICSGNADELASARWPSISGGLADGVRRDPPHGAAEGRERDQCFLRPRPWSLPRTKRPTTAEQLVPWTSDLLNVVLGLEDPEAINPALKAYFETYMTTGRRLSRVA